jgi:N-dimethylarginine dimethylaminohydrolase
VQLRTQPLLGEDGRPVVNSFSGWPDSFYYDLDLAVSVLKAPEYDGSQIVRNGLIGYCPAAFTPESLEKIRGLEGLDMIEVSENEAVQNLACNLVSTGTHVVMNNAPDYAAAVQAHGLEVVCLDNPELAKGGGSVRCTTLTLG